MTPQQRYRAKLTPEQRAAERESGRLRALKRRKEGKGKKPSPEKVREYQRRYRAKLSPEQLAAVRSRSQARSLVNYARRRIQRLEYARANRERQAKAELRRKYGLSMADMAALRDAQDGRCAICHDKTRLVVDHDHAIGSTRAAVRGLLCRWCNHIVHEKASPETLIAAANYITAPPAPAILAMACGHQLALPIVGDEVDE
jgi:hypothetical protein